MCHENSGSWSDGGSERIQKSGSGAEAAAWLSRHQVQTQSPMPSWRSPARPRVASISMHVISGCQESALEESSDRSVGKGARRGQAKLCANSSWYPSSADRESFRNVQMVVKAGRRIGHCGKCGHKQKDCRYKNTVAEVDEKESVEPPQSSASSRTTRVTPPPPGVFSPGTAQSTTGTISTLMEAHAQSGWLCELVGAQMREGEFVELLVDTEATEHVCGPHDFTHASLTNGPRPRAQDRDW